MLKRDFFEEVNWKMLLWCPYARLPDREPRRSSVCGRISQPEAAGGIEFQQPAAAAVAADGK